jgi:Peptidase A4 family
VVTKILRFGSAAVAAAGVILATGAFGLAPSVPATGSTAPTGRAAVARAAGSTARVVPGRPMIPLGAHGQQRAAGAGSGPAAAIHSVNWSGYAATRSGKSFSLVRATFFVPFLNCAVAPATFSAHWVGFDGFYGKPDSVEQDGIEADCVGTAGKTARYRAWYEMFPNPETVSSIKVNSGDSITATVSYSSATRRFRLTVTDNTNRRHFSVTKACAAHISCPRTSAQVISEAPANNHGQLLPMADYGAVAFASIAITGGAGQRGGLVSRRWRTTKIVQYGDVSRKRIAQPTAIHSDSFANYWLGPI